MTRSFVLVAVLLILTAQSAWPSRPQDAAAAATPKITFKFSIGGEYFARTLDIDEEKQGLSTLKTFLGLAGLGLGIGDRFEISLLGGYASSDMSGLLFQKLPFSVLYNAGGISGSLIGAEMNCRVFTAGDFETNIYGQFVSCSGTNTEWPISTLNVEGSADTVTSWTRLSVGPDVRYIGFESFTPYFSIRYDKLSGSFEMRETIQTLSGIEKKTLTANGLISLSAGTIFEASSNIKIQGEASLLPRTGGLDTAFQIKSRFSF